MFKRVALASILALVCSACTSNESVVVEPPPSSPSPLPQLTIDGCQTEGPPNFNGGAEPVPKLIEPGTLTVVTNPISPPFESEAEGKIVGFDIDLITELASRLEGKPKLKIVKSNQPVTDVATGAADAAISALSVRTDLLESVAFTNAYLTAPLTLVVRSSDVGTITGIDSLKGKIVGVQTPSKAETCARDSLKAQSKVEEVLSFDDPATTFAGLYDGTVDAALVDLPLARKELAERDGLAIVGVASASDVLAIAVSKSNLGLAVHLQVGIAKLLSDGTYAKIYAKWFKAPPELE